MNGVEPYTYLKTTLKAIDTGYNNNRLDELLPWNFESRSS